MPHRNTPRGVSGAGATCHHRVVLPRQPDRDGAATERSEVTFAADGLSTEDVVALLRTGLDRAGHRCGRAADLGGPMSLRVRIGRRDFGLLLGPLPAEARWLVSTSSGVRPAMRLLGDRADDQRRELTATLHDVLSSHPAISDVRWWTPLDRRDHPDRWSAHPHTRS